MDKLNEYSNDEIISTYNKLVEFIKFLEKEKENIINMGDQHE